MPKRGRGMEKEINLPIIFLKYTIIFTAVKPIGKNS